jgi:hypothetical protein
MFFMLIINNQVHMYEEGCIVPSCAALAPHTVDFRLPENAGDGCDGDHVGGAIEIDLKVMLTRRGSSRSVL